MTLPDRPRAVLTTMFLSTVTSLLLVGCGTFVAYPGPERPDSEVASIECYSRYYFVYIGSCHITAVSGRRPDTSPVYATDARVAPGRQWFEVAFESYFGGGGGVSDVCAFDLDMRAGHSYQIRAHSLKVDAGLLSRHGATLYKGSLQIEARSGAGAGETLTVALTCRPFGGALCREVSDCGANPAGLRDVSCVKSPEFGFGRCVHPGVGR